ncbi:MAG: UbiD family decarboxylase [Desulfurococcales archaeon]|nr:UbiD family decarboxylase [Desulfurococcales archaeon]
MLYLSDLIDRLNNMGALIRLKDRISFELEPTRRIKEAENLRKAIEFEVSGSNLKVVSNVVGDRSTLYWLMGVSGDGEAYEKLLKSLEGGGQASFIEESFSDYFKPYGGSFETLPAIKFFKGDGGRYITSSILVAKVPGEDSFNASVHRLMLIPGKGFAVRLVPRHLYRIYTENVRSGMETPVAVMIGCDPLLLLSASTSPPYGQFEFGVYGSLMSEDVVVSYTPKYGLPVQVSASVVIEGRISKELVDEGPFVDLLNLYDGVRKQPLIKVDGIYINKASEPLFHAILPGGNEHKLLMGFPKEASIWDAVRKAVPKVHKVRLTAAGGGWLHAVISITKNVDGDAKTAIMAAFGAHPSLKHVVIVDEDIDPDSSYDVEWAIATRFQADRDLVIIKSARGSTLDPSAADGVTAKMGLDATASIREKGKFMRPS